MPRILGVDVPAKKRLEIGLTYIFGVGPTRAKEICHKAGLSPDSSTSELNETQVATLAQILQDEYVVEGDLRRQVAQDIRRLVSINSYRGQRHRRSLPVRGQRTRTNARTRKGSKKTVGAIRDRATRKAAGAA
jgi:small subunit ribosomal protein S13